MSSNKKLKRQSHTSTQRPILRALMPPCARDVFNQILESWNRLSIKSGETSEKEESVVDLEHVNDESTLSVSSEFQPQIIHLKNIKGLNRVSLECLDTNNVHPNQHKHYM